MPADAQDWPEAGEVHVLAHPRQRLAHHQVGVSAQVLHNLDNVYIYSVADPLNFSRGPDPTPRIHTSVLTYGSGCGSGSCYFRQ